VVVDHPAVDVPTAFTPASTCTPTSLKPRTVATYYALSSQKHDDQPGLHVLLLGQLSTDAAPVQTPSVPACAINEIAAVGVHITFLAGPQVPTEGYAADEPTTLDTIVYLRGSAMAAPRPPQPRRRSWLAQIEEMTPMPAPSKNSGPLHKFRGSVATGVARRLELTRDESDRHSSSRSSSCCSSRSSSRSSRHRSETRWSATNMSSSSEAALAAAEAGVQEYRNYLDNVPAYYAHNYGSPGGDAGADRWKQIVPPTSRSTTCPIRAACRCRPVVAQARCFSK